MKKQLVHKVGRGRPVDAAMREKIISAAMRMFSERGLHATRMEHIARDLKISKLTLYSRFESKEELFSAVIEAKCEQYIPQKLFAGLEGLSAQDSLFQIAFGLLQLLASEEASGMERMLMGLDIKDGNELIMRFHKAGPARIKSLIANHLRLLHQNNQLHIPDAELATNIFSSLIKGSEICYRMHIGLKPKPTKKEMQHYSQQIVRVFILAHQKLT